MSAPRYASLTAKLLANAPAEGPPPTHEERAEAVAAMAAAIRARARRRRLVGAGLSFGAIAATLLVFLWLQRESSAPEPARIPTPVEVTATLTGRGTYLVDEGAPTEVSEPRALLRGSKVHVRPSGSATLALSTGSTLRLEPETELTVVEKREVERFALSRGALRAEVAKLRADQRFLIETIDAEVEVRGTSFRVEVMPENRCATRTHVEVFEGVVSVRQDGELHPVRAGERWPREADCRPPEKPRLKRPLSRHRPVPPPPPARETPSSHLGEENDLYAAAVAAARAGDDRRAIELYERLLERDPDGPLAETAASRRMKALEGFDLDRAAEAARRYLARYPEGFAREEARRIIDRTR